MRFIRSNRYRPPAFPTRDISYYLCPICHIDRYIHPHSHEEGQS